jgi:hypothetical protein
MFKRLIAALAAFLTMGALAVASAAPASASVSYTCFGYTGTFADPTAYPTVAYVTWQYGADNCFGISPGRHIWNASAGHPWSVIPGGGLADGLSGFYQGGSSSLYYKGVQVWVASSNHYFCQEWWSDTGWTGSWARC